MNVIADVWLFRTTRFSSFGVSDIMEKSQNDYRVSLSKLSFDVRRLAPELFQIMFCEQDRMSGLYLCAPGDPYLRKTSIARIAMIESLRTALELDKRYLEWHPRRRVYCRRYRFKTRITRLTQGAICEYTDFNPDNDLLHNDL